MGLSVSPENKIRIRMHIEKGSEQQPRAKDLVGGRAHKSEPPPLRQQRQDALSIWLYTLAGEQIQVHKKIIPKNAPESKEGEPARSL